MIDGKHIPAHRRVSPRKLAEELGVDRSTVYDWMTKGIRGIRLSCVYVGTRKYVPRAVYSAWQDAVSRKLDLRRAKR